MVIFNDMFTPLNLHHNYNQHLCCYKPPSWYTSEADIPQKQTCHYETYSIIFTASKVWNDVLRKENKNLLYCEFSAVKKTIIQSFSATMKIIAEMVKLYFVKLQFMVVIKLFILYSFTHIQYLFSILYAVSLYLLLYLFLFHLYMIFLFICFIIVILLLLFHFCLILIFHFFFIFHSYVY